jgi:hypothetical protein
MPMTPAQQSALAAWCKTRNVVSNCLACGTNNWAIGEIIAAPSQTKGGSSIGGPSIPMVQLVCKHCACVRLFAAVPIFGEDL